MHQTDWWNYYIFTHGHVVAENRLLFPTLTFTNVEFPIAALGIPYRNHKVVQKLQQKPFSRCILWIIIQTTNVCKQKTMDQNGQSKMTIYKTQIE